MNACCVAGLEAPGSSQAGAGEPVNMGSDPLPGTPVLGGMQSQGKANTEPVLALEPPFPLIKALTQQI